MRFIFRTRYEQDINLFRHNGDRFWYGLLMVLLLGAPLLLDEFYLGELTYVFILSVAGVGLMLLTGYTGLVSLGHAAFLGIGAYAHANFLNFGIPMGISLILSGLIAGAAGFAIGLPTLKLKGVYLAIATLAFGIILEKVFGSWEAVTGAYRGMSVESVEIGEWVLTEGAPFYYICLGVLAIIMLGAINLLRSPSGRALIAVRDSEIAAQSMGVDLTRAKTLAFTISAFITGVAGGLFAHKIGYIGPDAFNIILSIQLLLMVVVGGLGSLHGVVFGAFFVGALPQAIALMRDYLPSAVANQPGLEPGLFGLILVLFILFEPFGLYGRWRKIKLFFSLYPLYRKATFKRQKSFTRSERYR